MIESQPARASRDSHPCPPWCADDEDHGATHTTARTALRVGGRNGHLATCAGMFGAPPEVVVHATWSNPANDHALDAQGDLYVPLADAERLAGVIEVLAHATPGTHRELAAAIRQAAATITEAGQ